MFTMRAIAFSLYTVMLYLITLLVAGLVLVHVGRYEPYLNKLLP